MAAQVNKNKITKSKNRKNKVVLVFDEEKRKEFLGGFHKRKLQRKKAAQEKLALDLKEERKRLKKEARESYKKLVVSHKDIPELENLFTKEYDDDDVTVKVTELSTSDIAERNNWIGENRPQYEKDESESEQEIEQEVNVPGMELKVKPLVKKVKKEDIPEFSTKKEFKKALKKQATKNVQKSKAFQMKNKMERQKNKNKSRHQKNERMKVRDKKAKKRGGGGGPAVM